MIEAKHPCIGRHLGLVAKQAPGSPTVWFSAVANAVFTIDSATGKDSATLAPLDSNAHLKQTQAVQSIGQMHESLQATVGPALWQASMLDMEKKMSRYIRK